MRRTLRLALPVMVARLGLLVMVAVDTAMTGHAGGVELAYYALAAAPQVPLLLVGIGLLLGTIILTAQADGAGEQHECGAVWKLGLAHAFAYGLVLSVLCLLGEQFLTWTGQAPALARGGGRVLTAFAWGIPGILLYSCTAFFLEGLSRPIPGMLLMLFANVLNAALNWLLIYGNAGVPAMGAEGAALATSIVRWVMFVLLAGYVLWRMDTNAYGISGRITNWSALGRRFRRIGYPMGLAHGLEASAFASMTLFAGLLGPTQIAGFTVSMNLVALSFMSAIGIGTAAAVRVGNAVGRRDAHGVRMAGWVAVGLAAVLLAGIALVFYALPEALAGVYTHDPAVIAVVVPTIIVAALVLVPDGMQAVFMGALRGTADVWPATLLFLVSFWLVMVPAGYILGVVHAGGAPSLMIGVALGCVVAVVLLGWRFHVVSGRLLVRA